MSRSFILFLASVAAMAALVCPRQAFSDQAASEGYRLRPGDTLEITISGEPAYSGTFLLGAAGTILLADGAVGEIPVVGLTLEEAKTRMQESLAEYLKDPAVSVRITKFRVTVSGEVQNPGSYEITAGETVMDAINRAGGAKREIALARVELTRATEEKILLEPQGFLEKGDNSQNLLLQPGDEVLVGRSELGEEYKVSGAVKFPGSYPVSRTQPPRLFDALEAAGRWTEEADPRRALLIRKDGGQTTIDLSALDSQPGNILNLPLAAGDEIFVPRKTTQITVQGGVNNPGEYLVEESTTFLQAVGKAGGLKSDAILKECVLVRAKPQGKWLQVDLEKVLRKGDMKANPVVQDGDMLWVAEREPARPRRDAWDVIRNTIAPVLWALSL